MKTLLIGLFISGITLSLTTGCATPAYSGGLPTIVFPEEKATGENMNRVVRNMAYENRQLWEDINTVLLLDPPNHLTKWNLR